MMIGFDTVPRLPTHAKTPYSNRFGNGAKYTQKDLNKLKNQDLEKIARLIKELKEMPQTDNLVEQLEAKKLSCEEDLKRFKSAPTKQKHASI